MSLPPEHRRGLLHGIAAFIMWGLFPLYWRELRQFSPDTVVAVRALISGALLVGLLLFLGKWPAFRRLLSNPRTAALHLLTGTLLAVNWMLFIYATQRGHILDASLGYFLTPFLNVASGTLLLGETLRPAQKIALSCAALGVAVLFLASSHAPWLALGLAASFAAYGLLRKLYPTDPLIGLTIESAWAVLPALLWLHWHPLAWAASSPTTLLLLALAGVVTIAPLLTFASAAQRIPLTQLGLLQFIAPSLQFLCGLTAGETLRLPQLTGFLCIWLGCLLFARDLHSHSSLSRHPNI